MSELSNAFSAGVSNKCLWSLYWLYAANSVQRHLEMSKARKLSNSRHETSSTVCLRLYSDGSSICYSAMTLSCDLSTPKDSRRTHGRIHARTNRTKTVCLRPHYVGQRHENTYTVFLMVTLANVDRFLPARRYASAGLCDSDVSVRLSVCPSVRRTPVFRVLCLAERKQDREMYRARQKK